ncbi:S-adenosyl-L-methionine-dependent methyltransferase [Chytriomyces sp. MP71]|nr:S-adenosyl-L-methionine-dependent methyltransferase [Chytriomyces sp. MP71]
MTDFEALERTHVQAVYEAIAPHFSATRYKPWPVVEQFLNSLPESSLGIDVGCGNGKYLGVNKTLFTVGSDMSANLVSIAANRGFEALVADNLSMPYRSNAFDFALSIAVIHHFSTFERRVAAVREITRTLKSGAKVLIFVWALEQGSDVSKRRFDKQDVFVPWNLDAKTFVTPSGTRVGKNATAALSDSSKPSPSPTVSEAVSEAVNATVANTIKSLSLEEVPENAAPKVVVKSGNENIVYQRYYHVFVKGELDEVVQAAGGLEIVSSGYDRDNWYIIANKV